MSNESVKANAGAEESPVASKNITAAQFIALRSGKEAPKAPAKEESKAGETVTEEAKTAPVAQTKEGGAAEQEVAPKDKEVLSKEIDLETMSESDLRELADKLGSRAVARFGELTAKRKHAEEQLAALQQQIAARNQPDPLTDPRPKENPYSSITTLADLQAKAKEVEEVIEWAEEVLWKNESAGAEEVVETVNGNQLTKAQVRRAMRDAQKARKEHLPAQFRELQAVEQRKTLRGNLEQAARKEIPWLAGEDNDTRKQYEVLANSPILIQAKKQMPELEPYLEYMVAHAANSIYGRKEIPIAAPPAKSQITPPSNPTSISAKAETPEGRGSKEESNLKKSLNESKTVNAYVALRTAQLSKRKSL